MIILIDIKVIIEYFGHKVSLLDYIVVFIKKYSNKRFDILKNEKETYKYQEHFYVLKNKFFLN